jgi:hypothetical protein
MLSFPLSVGRFQVLAWAVDATRLILSAFWTSADAHCRHGPGTHDECEALRWEPAYFIRSSFITPTLRLPPTRPGTFLGGRQRERNGANINTEEV